jgi:hypothetical protein
MNELGRHISVGISRQTQRESMKFQIGDATDAALCVALKHEYLRCDDAFSDFASSAKIMSEQGENRRSGICSAL